MKNQNNSRITRLLKSAFNVRSWIDYDRVRTFTAYIWDSAKKMFVPQKEDVKDASSSFREMVASMNLSEQDLKDRQSGLYRLSMIMCVGAFLLFCYTVYNLTFGHWKAAVVSLVITALALVLAFRYHFWYFQIKERKLGCTFREWYKRGILGEK